MGALIAADMSVRNPGYISSITLVNPTSIEGNCLKNACSENMT